MWTPGYDPGSGPAPRRTLRRPGASQRPRARPAGRGRAGGSDPLLLGLGLLPHTVAQVVELGPADVAPGGHLQLGDDRGVHREGALHAHAEAHLAHGEGLLEPGAL